jgi:glycosyltransferase involved in cell wall biosynthesis
MIFIDASRYNNTARKTGVENYSIHLINELIKLAPKEITLISPRKIKIGVPEVIIPFPRLWTLIRLSTYIGKHKEVDNLFVPSHVLPLIHPKNSTITIHDVAFKHLPESYGLLSRTYLNWAAKFAVKHAKKIIVPSTTTKTDLIKFYKADEKKIHVIPLGFDKKNAEHAFQRAKRPYFLFVGRIEHKKNTDTLIKAFQKFAEKNADIDLVLAGFTGRGGDKILASIPWEIRNRIRLTGYVGDKEKNELMYNALCFVFPSRYEGFGLPLLEAMAYELPIIASRIPTSYEIAKDNAVFFETENTDELAGLLKQVAENKKMRDEMTIHHKETLKKYSWQKIAEQTWKVLEK